MSVYSSENRNGMKFFLKKKVNEQIEKKKLIKKKEVKLAHIKNMEKKKKRRHTKEMRFDKNL